MRGGRAFLGLEEWPSATMGCCFSIIFLTSNIFDEFRIAEKRGLRKILGYLTLTKYLTNRFLCVKKENLKTKCNNCSSILQLKTFESIVDSSFKRMVMLCPICGQLTDSNNTKRDYPILNDNFITIDIDKKETYWITVIGYQIAKQQQLISSNFYTDQNSVKICVPKQFSRVSISINSEQEDSFITVSLGAR